MAVENGRAPLQHLPPPGHDQLPIGAEAHARLLHVGPCLLQGQGETAQLGGHRRGRRLVVGAGAGQQEGRCLGLGPHVDVEGRAQRPPGGVAGGDQHPAPTARGQEGAEGGRVLGVVEHHQPALPAPQLGVDQAHDRLGVVGGQAEVLGQGGEGAGDGSGDLGGHPPHQVVVRRPPPGVLDAELGLAHPAQAGHGQQRHRGSPSAQGRAQLVELVVTAGEVGVARRDVPDGGEPAGEGLGRAGTTRAREPRLGPGLGPLLLQPGEQPSAGSCLVPVDEVDAHDRSQQARGPALADPHADQTPVVPGGVGGERRRPLRGPERRVQVLLGEQGHDPVAAGQRVLHLDHEVRTRPEVPGLHDRGEPGVLQYPRHPLGPRFVSPCVADEEVDLRLLVRWFVRRHGSIVVVPVSPCWPTAAWLGRS